MPALQCPLVMPAAMNEPLKLGIAGLGTVGTGPAAAAARARRPAGRESRPPHRGDRGVCARTRSKKRAVAFEDIAWFEDAARLAADPSIDVFVELIGGEEGVAQGRRRGGAQGRQARRHRQQGAARQARHRAGAARREERRGAQLRGRGRRRHPHHQDAARGARRQPDPPRLRHPQRHLQLHPDPDAGGAPLVRRRAGGGAGQGLCRGRPHLRHRRLRHRPQAGPADQPRLRHPRRLRADPHRGHPDHHARPTSRRPTISATASSCSAWR